MEPETIYFPEEHPWVELLMRNNAVHDKTVQDRTARNKGSHEHTARWIGLSEEILYSLDEIRVR